MVRLNPFKTISNKRLGQQKSGVAVLEFLFAAPAFFIIVFFVIEIALIWNDRHIMRLAAYRAAKTVVKARNDANTSSNLCWSIPVAGAPIDAKSQVVQTTARRSASKIMATINPSVTQLLMMFRVGILANGSPAGKAFDDFIDDKTESKFGSVVSTISNNPYVHAIARMTKGLPAAWIFTDLRCQDIKYPAQPNTKETNGIEITLVYHRSAKMPYVGTLMWMLRKLQEFATLTGLQDDGTNGPLKVDPLNYGIVVNDPLNSAQVIAAELMLRKIILDKAQEIGTKIGEKIDEKTKDFSTPVSSSGAVLPEVFGSIAGTAFDTVAGELRASSAVGAINWISNTALDLFLQTPDELKTVPITVSVRMPNFNQAYENSGNPWDGSAGLIGSFTNTSKIAKLAKKLGEVMDTENPPNGGGGLPYVTE